MYLKLNDVANPQKTMRKPPPPPQTDDDDLFDLIDDVGLGPIIPQNIVNDGGDTSVNNFQPISQLSYGTDVTNTQNKPKKKYARTTLSLLLLGLLLLVFIAFELWSTSIISLFESVSTVKPDWTFYGTIAILFSIFVLVLIWFLDLPVRDLLAPP